MPFSRLIQPTIVAIQINLVSFIQLIEISTHYFFFKFEHILRRPINLKFLTTKYYIGEKKTPETINCSWVDISLNAYYHLHIYQSTVLYLTYVQLHSFYENMFIIHIIVGDSLDVIRTYQDGYQPCSGWHRSNTNLDVTAVSWCHATHSPLYLIHITTYSQIKLSSHGQARPGLHCFYYRLTNPLVPEFSG